MTAAIWFTKLILSHLLTDFILQPTSWVAERKTKHFTSPKLYLHGFITAALALIITEFQHWQVAIIIFITHTLIDGWKSYRNQNIIYFLIDQLLHLVVIAVCCFFTFMQWSDVLVVWQKLNNNIALWKTITAFVFITAPAGILIGQFTQQWRDKIENAESLANAGKWIGMIERVIILIFVIHAQYSAIGLLVASQRHHSV